MLCSLIRLCASRRNKESRSLMPYGVRYGAILKATENPTSKRREYPELPVLAVGGAVVKDGSVLLIRRGQAPSLGEWSLPGGMVELGERVRAAVHREIKEETGLNVEPVAMAAVFERIVRQGSRVRYHYTVLDYACRLRGGHLRHGSDVTDARWVRRKDLNRYHLRRTAQEVIRRSFEILEAQPVASARPRQTAGKN